MMPPLSPASTDKPPTADLRKVVHKALGRDMPIPEWRWKDLPPPFTFERNGLDQLEFRMNQTRWRHVIYIHFLPEKRSAIAYFWGKMNYHYYQMMMLMGHTLRPSPDAGIFREFVSQTGRIIFPPHVEACELVQDS
ncbi:hypothetical protein APTSU1_000134300 [Apodemus speciosus]|uniref:Uncharacterized protein n=1 Tax=Apodemus speciosus TaxID=105296 RepID=A0ABQ0EG49_APOSI